MNNIDKYLNLNFTFKNSPFTKSYNCLGLIEKFYQDHNYNIKFEDGKPWQNLEKHSIYLPRLIRFLKSRFNQTYNIDDLEYGDIVCLKTGAHTGIYLGKYKILCMEFEAIDNVSKSRIYEKDEWIDKFKYGFKRKKESL